MKSAFTPLSLLILAVTLGSSLGCRHEGAYAPVGNTAAALENRERVVMLDRMVQSSVDVSNIQDEFLPDGRLRVTANIRNREERRIQVEVDCVFKNEDGFPIGDKTPFQTFILTENAQQGVQFVSMNDKAKTATIRVRQAH
jgi:hypothetical protein